MKFSEFREKNRTLSEKISKSSGKTVKDPPHVLILRRTGIRIFPTGEKVALYTTNKLDMTFSVPYNTMEKGIQNVSVNEELLSESSNQRVLYQLQKIVDDNEIKDVKFNNNSTTRVNVTTAKSILQLHSQLNPSNQIKLSKMLNTNPENLAQVSDFAFKNLK
jgi:hypothetical protein